MKSQPGQLPTPPPPRSEKEWDGFRFTAYTLVVEKVWNLRLTRKSQAEGSTEEIQTTVGEIYKSLANCHTEIESWAGCDMIITTETGKLAVDGLAFNRDVLEALLGLRNDGVDPFTATWFWYDRNSVRDMPQASYSFFVVHDDKIVREHLSFGDYDSYNYASFGFDPSIFLARNNSDSIWRNDPAWEGARIRFWYRKFYTETRTGQLMVLRDDEPALYDAQYYRRRSTPDLLTQNIPIFLNLFGKIHILLWVVILLGALILWRLWR